ASGGGDSFTETTSTSWLQRIKDAIGGVVFGVTLVALGCGGLFWNEGRAVQTARSLAEGGSAVVTVDAAKPDPKNDNKLVHVSGPVRTSAPVTDTEFGVSTNGIRLVRMVEMFQWKEEKRSETRKKLGGGEETVTHYTYRRDWSSSREDSSRFHNPDGHRNPEMRYGAADLVSKDAMVGGFRASEAVLRKISAREELRVDPALASHLRSRVNGPLYLADGRIYLGSNPADARVGDHRISYRFARPEQLSIVGRQSGDGFDEYQTNAGDRLLMASPGMVPAKDMFRAAERENTVITWLVRLFGTLGVFVGFALVLRPLVVVADFVPLLGSILGAGAGLVSLLLTFVLAPLVIAIAWFYYRPLVAIVILAGGAAAAFAVKLLASRKALMRGMPAPAPAE
ncbi:MAG: TMEM43 family protein, partial [Variibacter sp.]|nr:TMEM43 family protein [Variibacter sp.]